MAAADEEKSNTVLSGTVEKVIKPIVRGEPEKVQIAVEGADDLYREIRIENTLTKEDGEKVALKVGAHVEVTVEADAKDTVPAKVTEKGKGKGGEPLTAS